MKYDIYEDFLYTINAIKTRTKVVHKYVSQGCNQVRSSYSKK